MRRTTAAVLLGAGLLALAGCSGSTAPKPQAAASTSPAPDDYGCLTDDQAKGSFQLELDGQSATADAFAAGSGKVGVVFAHMAGETVCEWAPMVSAFAKKGYTALTFTAVGETDENVASAVAELKRRGVTKVLLVGGSKGGTAVLVAASRPLAVPVEAVVSLSAPHAYEGMDAATAVPKLTMPVFFMADASDSGFAEDAQTLARAAVHSPHHQVHLYPGSAHASAVLGDSTALADFNQFISTYAGPI